MKKWQGVLLTALLVTMPVFSACDSQKKQDELYRQQLEAIQKIQEANQQQQEAYNKALEKGLNEWSQAYSDWQAQQQQQQIQAAQEQQRQQQQP